MVGFGERLKGLREDKGLGQIELANALSVSKAIISMWETGRRSPTADSIILIAKFFDVPSDYLLGLEN